MSSWETGGRSISVIFDIETKIHTPARRYFILDQPDTVLAPVPCITWLRIDSGPGKSLHPHCRDQDRGGTAQSQNFRLPVLRPAGEAYALRRQIRKAVGKSLGTMSLSQLELLDIHDQSDLYFSNHSLEFGDLRNKDGRRCPQSGSERLNTTGSHTQTRTQPVSRLQRAI